MPFTLSHTAAVLPFAHLLRRWRLLSAAVIGSMVPDAGVFIPVLPRDETHSKVALFVFCVPVGLLCYWIFQRRIKPVTYELLPDRLYLSWRKDAPPASLRDLRQWGFAALGVLLGAFTHLVWDAFTHEGARGVNMLTAIDGALEGLGLAVAGHPFKWYRVLQHVSSVAGLAFVMWFVWRDLRNAPPPAERPARRLDAQQRHRWFALYVVVALGSAAVVFAFLQLRIRAALVYVIGNAAIASLWGLLISLLLVSALLRRRLARSSA